MKDVVLTRAEVIDLQWRYPKVWSRRAGISNEEFYNLSHVIVQVDESDPFDQALITELTAYRLIK